MGTGDNGMFVGVLANAPSLSPAARTQAVSSGFRLLPSAQRSAVLRVIYVIYATVEHYATLSIGHCLRGHVVCVHFGTCVGVAGKIVRRVTATGGAPGPDPLRRLRPLSVWLVATPPPPPWSPPLHVLEAGHGFAVCVAFWLLAGFGIRWLASGGELTAVSS